MTPLEEINTQRLLQTVRGTLEQALAQDNPLDLEAQKVAINKAIGGYVKDLVGHGVVNTAQVQADNLVSATYVKRNCTGFPHQQHDLNVVFEASTETRRYKMSWRRAKIKMARYLKREGQNCRQLLTIAPVVPVEYISLRAIVTPEGITYGTEDQLSPSTN